MNLIREVQNQIYTLKYKNNLEPKRVYISKNVLEDFRHSMEAAYTYGVFWKLEINANLKNEILGLPLFTLFEPNIIKVEGDPIE